MRALKICIAPLDWGLGHATRCIVLANALQSMGHTVFMASEGGHAIVLKEALPDIHHLTLKGYRIRYAKNSFWWAASILFQIPKIIYSIYYEYRWIQKQQANHHFDIVISDNRFGVFTKHTKNVFITHQLYVQTPWKFATSLFQKMQYRWLQHFDECWVPDSSDTSNNLSGILAHPKTLPNIPLFYIGALSRLFTTERKCTFNPFPFLVLISGPEPQRTQFEKMICTAIKQTQVPCVVVAGRPKDPINKVDFDFIGERPVCFSHVDAATLAALIDQTDVVICRGGYTTLMELVPFKKQLILVPTPGQTEQVYLADLWTKKNWAIALDQEKSFTLSKALEQIASTKLTNAPFEDLNIDLIKARLDIVVF